MHAAIREIASTATHKTLNRMLSLLLFAIAFFGVQHLMPNTLEYAPPATTPAQVEPVNPLIAVAEEHRCWTGDQRPLVDGFPGHVLLADGSVGGPRLVGKALEQIFDGKDHGLTIYAFCV